MVFLYPVTKFMTLNSLLLSYNWNKVIETDSKMIQKNIDAIQMHLHLIFII